MRKAYFRELQHSGQCELVFPLKILDETGAVVFEEEIHAVRKCSDNIRSLLEHIKNKIKKSTEDKEIKDVNVTMSMTRQGTEIAGDTECLTLIQQQHRDVLFTICNESFEVVVNAPLVKTIVLPNIVYVSYVLQPTKFKAIHTEKQKCEYIWFKSVDKVSWTEIAQTYKYSPTEEDLHYYLKLRCIPKNSLVEGPEYEVISKTVVQEMSLIPVCPFENRHAYTRTKLDNGGFRVVSYNTLADLYSENNSYFPYCSLEALSIDYRKQLILKELIGYNADIMCLQEVDHQVYTNYFRHKFKNYRSVFHRKGNRIPEGLVCLFNPEKFKKLEAKHLVFGEEVRSNSLFSRTWRIIKLRNTLKECFIKQPTSLQVTVLKFKQSNKIVIVANTHLYYHSEANDVRVLQVVVAIEYIKDMVNKWKRSFRNADIAVIFCGDFNSVPTSAVYKFCSTGTITYTFEENSEAPLVDIVLNHTLKLTSAYGTPMFTNYTGDFKACLDYIFYDNRILSLIDSVPIPEESILSERIALPNEVFPSDHIALIANFKFL